MSDVLIQQYLNELQDLRRVSGTSREMVVREAFKDLLKGWGRSKDLVFVPEYEIETPAKRRRYVDGALLQWRHEWARYGHFHRMPNDERR